MKSAHSLPLILIVAVSAVGCSSPQPVMWDAAIATASLDSGDDQRAARNVELSEPVSFAKRLPAEEFDRRETDKGVASPGSTPLPFLPPLVIDFESFPSGSLLDDVAVAGVTFARKGAPLVVVNAAETWTPPNGWMADLVAPESYRLIASSGQRLLSPGGAKLSPGPNPDREIDSFSLLFDPPVCQVALDFASQSADGMSFVTVEVLNTNGDVLYSSQISIKDRTTPDCDRKQRFAGPGLDTWSFSTADLAIAEVRLIDSDNDASCPDSNFGVDSIRFAPAPRWAAADLNDDGIVNALDVARVVSRIQSSSESRISGGISGGTSGRIFGAPWTQEDLNCDQRVDSLDLAIALEAVGTATNPL